MLLYPPHCNAAVFSLDDAAYSDCDSVGDCTCVYKNRYLQIYSFIYIQTFGNLALKLVVAVGIDGVDILIAFAGLNGVLFAFR